MSIDRSQGNPNAMKFPTTIAQSLSELAGAPASHFSYLGHVSDGPTYLQTSNVSSVSGLVGRRTSTQQEGERLLDLASYNNAICLGLGPGAGGPSGSAIVPCSDTPDKISSHDRHEMFGQLANDSLQNPPLPWLSASSGTYLKSPLNSPSHLKYSAKLDDVGFVSNGYSYPQDMNKYYFQNNDLAQITTSKRLNSSAQLSSVEAENTSPSTFRSNSNSTMVKVGMRDHYDDHSPSLSCSTSRAQSPLEDTERNSVVSPSSTSDEVAIVRWCDTTHIAAGVRDCNSPTADSHGNSTEADSSEAAMLLPPDVKVALSEACPVCGDKVSGYHYGLLTCESCKGFFKRTVQNKKIYSCSDRQVCPVDKSQRKRCPSCRFQKCIQVGMKVEAVRTDRMRGGRNKFGPIYKRDRAIKLQAVQKHSPYVPQRQHTPSGDNCRSYGGDDCKDVMLRPTRRPDTRPVVNVALLGHAPSIRVLPPIIKELQENEIDANELSDKMIMFVQYQLETHSRVTSEMELQSLFCRTLDHMLLILVDWLRSALFFKEISVDDQMKILQSTWPELAITEILYSLLDEESWSRPFLKLCVSKSEDDAHEVGPSFVIDIVTQVNELVQKLHTLQVDNVDYSCIKYLIVLNPDTGQFDDRSFLVGTQDRISEALFDYCVSFFPHVPDKFGKLLLLLPEIRLIGLRLEGMLYQHLLENGIASQCLLAELLQAKK